MTEQQRVRRPRRRLMRILGVGLVVVIGALAVRALLEPRRTTPVFEPPVVAGQQLWGCCAGGFYARLADTIVVTSTGHCTSEGAVAYEPDGTTMRGVFGPVARDATCPHEGHTCRVVRHQLPRRRGGPDSVGPPQRRRLRHGRLSDHPAGTRPLACDDIAIGETAEINGRNVYRSGEVVEKGENLHAGDPAYFPCMIAATIHVESGDSGGAVLVRRHPGRGDEPELRRLARVHAARRGVGAARA